MGLTLDGSFKEVVGFVLGMFFVCVLATFKVMSGRGYVRELEYRYNGIVWAIDTGELVEVVG